MKFTPNNITKLGKDEVIVIGSNTRGIHGAGAAKTAHEKFGLEWGVGEGISGQTYAFPTKDSNIKTLPLSDIAYSVAKFISVVNSNPDKTFYVTLVACGLAGYKPKDIAPLFKKYKPLPKNIIWPEEFYNIIFYNS